MEKMLRVLLTTIGIWFLGFGISSQAAVDIYLSPTKDLRIIGNMVTYTITLQADADTRIEALGDIFLAYDKELLTLVTENVKDLATQIEWTDMVLNTGYKDPRMVSGNWGLVRFAKISLNEKMFLTANVPAEVLTLPFRIDPAQKFTVTRLYFPRALVIDDSHKNVLRNAADSFLIRQRPVEPKKPLLKKKVNKRQ